MIYWSKNYYEFDKFFVWGNLFKVFMDYYCA